MRITNNIQLIAMLTLALMCTGLQAQSVPATVGSAEEAQSVLESRSEFMKGLGSAMKAFSNYLKRGDGEPLELGAMAAEIAANAPRIPDLFPRDTGMAQFGDSEAKPDIWNDWEDFVVAANALVEPAMALEAAFESGDPADIGAKVKALGGKGCRGCHKPFREKRN